MNSQPDPIGMLFSMPFGHLCLIAQLILMTLVVLFLKNTQNPKSMKVTIEPLSVSGKELGLSCDSCSFTFPLLGFV